VGLGLSRRSDERGIVGTYLACPSTSRITVITTPARKDTAHATTMGQSECKRASQ
jgi:hypothetical protein